jgi:hypothetical protein
VAPPDVVLIQTLVAPDAVPPASHRTSPAIAKATDLQPACFALMLMDIPFPSRTYHRRRAILDPRGRLLS